MSLSTELTNININSNQLLYYIIDNFFVDQEGHSERTILAELVNENKIRLEYVPAHHYFHATVEDDRYDVFFMRYTLSIKTRKIRDINDLRTIFISELIGLMRKVLNEYLRCCGMYILNLPSRVKVLTP